MSEVMDQHQACQSYLDALLETDKRDVGEEMAQVAPVTTRGRRCLLFSVAGLQLALPLERLAGIRGARFAGRKDDLQGAPSAHPVGHVVDTQARIFAGSERAFRERDYPYVLVLDEGRWGLGCDVVGDVIDLTASQVQWRGERGRRAWLAGTLQSPPCALLDVDACLRLWGPSSSS